MKSLLSLLLLPALSFGFKYPDLEGTWKGIAERTVCAKSAGSVNVVLTLEDGVMIVDRTSYHKVYDGRVSGTITAGENSGKFMGKFDKETKLLQRDALASLGISTYGGLLGQKRPPQTDYWPKLTASDPYKHLGYYQKLSGTITTSNYKCSDQGILGEQLKVELTKQ